MQNLSSDQNTKIKESWIVPAALVGFFAYLWFSLMRITTPYLLGGDQVYFWTFAKRMLDGERIYKDFFQFTPPGTDLVFAGMFHVFGATEVVANSVELLLGMVSAWLCYTLARRFMPSGEALLASAYWLVILFGKSATATHHWFSMFFVMLAVKVFVTWKRPARAFVAGVLLGLASFFTQTRGLFACIGFVAFLTLDHFLRRNSENDREESGKLPMPWMIVAGYFGTVFITYFRFVATAPKQAWSCLILYPYRYMGGQFLANEIIGLPTGEIHAHLPKVVESLAIVLIVLIAIPVTILILKKKSNQQNSKDIWLLAAVGSALLAEVLLSPNRLRIEAVGMPSIILLAWLLSQLPRLRCVIGTAVWALVIVTALWQIGARYKTNQTVITLPIGRVATTNELAAQILWTAERTKEGDRVFDGEWPRFYFSLKLRNPFYIDTAYTADDEHELTPLTLRQIETAPPEYIFWSEKLDRLPALGALRAALQLHYKCLKKFANGEYACQRIDESFTNGE